MTKPAFLVIAHTNLGSSLSGGDRIFLNLIRCWQQHFDISVVGAPESKALLQKYKVKSPFVATVKSISPIRSLSTASLIAHHFLRFITGLWFALTHPSLFKSTDYIYTASDFYGDFVIGLVGKLYNPKAVWLCGFYLLAPTLRDPHSPYIKNRQYFRGLVYFLAQIPSKFLAKKFADTVFVTSTPDTLIFPGKSVIIQGGVNVPPVKVLKTMLPVNKRPYDAFYLGRLHSQKGVVELIDIWNRVVKKIPKAHLVMVGDGELLPIIQQKIAAFHLQKNITLKGFMVGKAKFDLIKKSKLVVHPAVYDSGGMAAAESMAYGLPGVSFDLPALKTYYPYGMVKTPPGDFDKFSANIIKLLNDPKTYARYSKDARQLTIDRWEWQNRFNEIYDQVFGTKLKRTR